ncbi:sialate O-acetylesterase [Polaribacter vadi]|uniref:sialate O-acetylesterase n=1 Tax=Polaribacter TaxID=52959 RepID=UPI001C0A2434|nr:MULTISPECIES: sialate O-acetylesterase [Polaribacter]MBU3011318.1 sialate O-acetylesterase [Polaribacter vadi]MDO6741130.1 sialate O-acetylesterase [Polaribacter sp. 1_MG-2023]
MKLLLNRILCCFLLLVGCKTLTAQTKLPSILSDNMLLQQSSEVKIWGWDNPGQNIIVNPSWSKSIKTITDESGKWELFVSTPKAGKIGKMKISGSTKLSISNILFGEVWLCSGQSNMERELGFRNGQKPIVNFWEESQKATSSSIRMFVVQRKKSETPLEDCVGKWVECTPETVLKFSAVGYFFGKQLSDKLNTPIGLIQSAWGGTKVEPWTPIEGIEKTMLKKGKQNKFSNLYNGMIAPLTNYKIKGAIWYQGESNVLNWKQYKTLFPNMITSWRNQWNIGSFPFYFVQIAPYNYPDKFGVPRIVEAQLEALKLPNTGVAATQDIGAFYDIHPPQKKEVGRRLSLIALNNIYGKKEVVYTGPFLKSYKIESGKLIIQFETPGSQLHSVGAAMGKIPAFYIAGENKTFHKAQVKQDGNKIIVSSSKVKNPVAIRYNWKNNANGTIYNKHGLPALPFRTDNWDQVLYAE